MSWEGTVIGEPFAGFRILWDANIKSCDSKIASGPKGKWTAIWSPSKSALNAVHTSGCNWIAFPSMSLGWNAWIPKRCSVGARFKSTGCPFNTFSKISQTTGSLRSIIFFADFTVLTIPLSIILRIMNGLYNSAAMSFGNPHSNNFNSGPTTITERAE